MLDHSITNHIAYDLYKTPDLISKDFSVPRIITYLLWFLDRLSIDIWDV